jgi:hypothetical protein
MMDIDRQSCDVCILHAKCVDNKLEIREARYYNLAVNVCKIRVRILLVWRSSARSILLLLKNRIMDIDRQSCDVCILHAKCVDDLSFLVKCVDEMGN